MRKIYVFVALLCVATALRAQQITFRTSYNIALLDIPGNIIQNPQRNYVMAGTNTSFIPLYGNVTELDTIGNIAWSKGYSAGSIATDLWDIKNVSGGGYIATGSTGTGALLMRLTSTGTVTWAYRYRVGSNTDEHGNRVIETSDGGFAVAGYVYDADPDGAGALARQDSANLFCFKVNSSGTLVWAKTFFVSTSYINDHSLSDVAEVSDGYIFTGYSSDSNIDDDGTSAIILKTDKASGTLLWSKRYTAADEANSVVPLSGTEVLVSGSKSGTGLTGNNLYYLKVSSAGAVNSGNQYAFPGLLSVAIPDNGFVTNDGQYAFTGTYLVPTSFLFGNYTMKVNSSTGAVSFTKAYNAGFSTLFSKGIQAADSGYISISLAQQSTGFNYHVVKTDKNGNMNNTACDTIVVSNPSRSSYSPTLSNMTLTELAGAPASAVTIAVATLSPTQTVECLTVPCTPPATPTASATSTTICSGQSTTISGSGSGSGVTYSVYTAPTGGTLLGTAPLQVSPTGNTTYYVEASNNSIPGCYSSRGSVAVTVNQPPSAVGSITGSTSPCPGAQAYSISAVSGATTYTWAVPPAGGSVTGGQGTTNATVTWTNAGNYTVTVTATNTCGSTSATQLVNVQSGPPAAVGAITGSTNPCPGSQTYSISNVANATTYTWSVSNGGTITAGQSSTSITVNWTTSGGPYTVSVTASNNCGTTSNSVNVNVQNGAPGTLPAISGPATPCLGSQTYSVTAVSGSPTYTWSVSAGGTITSGQGSTSINVNWTTAGGPYTVSVTAANTCGNNSQTLAVTVSPGVSGVTASASPNPACVGDAVQLSGSGNGVSTWSWSGPNSFASSQQSPSISSITPTQAGVYTLTASSSCGTATATVNITVNNIPQNVTASANPNPACAGQTVLFTGSATGATSWGWSGPNNFISSQQNPSIANAQANASGPYTLLATNTCGSVGATVTLTVNEAPTAVTATATPNPVCQGTTVNLSGSATGATTYVWSGPNNFSANQVNASVSNFQQVNAGTYTLAASNTCGTTTATVNVTLSTGPTNVTASATQTDLCFGSTLALNGNATGATSYSWTGPNGFTSTQQSPNLGNVTLADSGTYTLTATNACGNATATVLVDIDSTITNVNINAAPDDTICSGGSLNLSATGNNADNWSWTGPNNFTSTQQNPSIGVATQVNSGTYYVTASNACNDVLDSLKVLVNTIPITPGTINGSLTACGSDTATYTVTGISNATSYNWTVSNGGSIISGQGTTSISVLWGGATGSYTVSVTAGNNCGNSTATSINVSVLAPAPVMNTFIIGDTAVCPGSYPYNITSVPNATGYTWTVSNGGTITSGQGTTSVNVNWATSGAQTLSVVATNTCGNSSAATANVTVFPQPTTPTVTLTDDTICEGSSTTLTGSNSNGGSGIVYHFYDAATGGNMYASNPLTVSPTQTTTYYLEVTNGFGCTAAGSRIPVTVYVIPAPAVLTVTAANDSVCYNTATTLTATATPGSTITWWDGPLGGNQLGSGNTYTTDNLQFNTTYYVQATSTGGCQNLQGRVPVTVNVIELPVVTLTTDKDQNIAFPNEAITFTASPAGYSNYEFFVNGNSVQSGTSNTWASAKLSDKDTVSVIATANGCASAESEVVVTIADFPNAFTPNGDGVNDVFLKDYELLIFNRWGQKLYEGIEGWDGTYNGDKVSAGTYYYIVTLKNITDRDSQIKGNVLLIQE